MKQPILKKLVGYPLLVTALIGGGAGPQSFAQAPPTVDPLLPPPLQRMIRKTTNDQRKAAAAAAAAKRAAAAKVAAPMAAAVQGAPMAFASYAPGVIAPPGVMNPRGTPDYMGGIVPNWARSPIIRKFVNTLPGLGPNNANNLGNFIPIATKDTTTYPGSDYYNIGVVDYTQKVHSDLPVTKFRGYKDLSPGADGRAHYLGPVIIAQRDRPVRVKFQNLLPLSNAAGTTFLPVDTSAMGSGPAPGGGTYTQNRAELHLHGGLSPWISDGTPHQWITPAGDPTPYKKGVAFADVPDMPATTPGDGTQYYYYTNQQSGRFMFYHDHSYGLTRLNVYAGEASGYLIVDPVDDKLINAGVLPGAAMPAEYRYGIPLIIQDKSFVPGPTDLAQQDPTWDEAAWGGYGSLWFPHVYMPNQDPSNSEGANPMGRWDYGPWFWPPVPVADTTGAAPIAIPLDHGPKSLGPGLPDYPGTPNPSLVPEGFMDTTMVNGTPYPTLTVEPKAYRFRILNGSNDRPYSLSFYKADATGTEVTMIPATAETAALGPLGANDVPLWPSDGRDGGVVSYATKGPDIIQIGTESGFLPTPVVIPPQPTTYNFNRRDIVVLNIANKALFLMPAERADVVVDFSQYAGQTLILYNDMLAPVPAFDVRYDYFTGAPDQTTTGGAPPTLPGYGPNTRTLMQIKVAATAPAPVFNLPALEAAFTGTSTAKSAFAEAQHPPIVPQTFYNSAMNTAYTADTYGTIQGNTLAYTKTENGLPAGPLPGGAIDLKPKAIHELFELDYGRMNAILAVELPLTNFNNQTTIPLAYTDPTTEVLKDGETQLWKITHNGVDTHPVHFHLFDVQIVNRVGWDGAVRFPDPNELGWKETVKMNPLEDIIVALRPLSPRLPFTLSNSNRPLNVTKLSNESFWVTDMTNVTPVPAGNLGNMTLIPNTPVNFGWEYVWHCHILGHEENDFMRAMQLNVAIPGEQPFAPTVLTATAAAPTRVDLAWTDNSTNEVGFTVQRQTGAGAFATIGKTVPDQNNFSDMTAVSGTAYTYRVFAYNQAGDSAAPTNTAAITASATPPAATGVTLTPSLASPQASGTPIIFTAAGQGSFGFVYRFWLWNGVWWNKVQDWSATPTWTLPASSPLGSYQLQVDVSTVPASPFQEAMAQVNYMLTAPVPATPVTVQLTPNLPSPQTQATPIVFTAVANGGANFMYRFWVNNGVWWNKVQDWSITSTYALDPASPVGDYQVQVDVSTNPVTPAQENLATVNFSLVAPAPLSLTPSAASPQPLGTSVIFTAAGPGAGAHVYRFWLWNGVWWQKVQDWNANPLWVFPSTKPAGTYTVQVDVSSNLATPAQEAMVQQNYTINP